jgi:hypothetical protein
VRNQASEQAPGHRVTYDKTSKTDKRAIRFDPCELGGTSMSSSKAGWREILEALGCGVLGFALVATAVHLLLRHPIYLHANIRSEKLSILQHWRGRAYSASFGSSHVHNGFDPRTFDAVMRGTAAETRSLNLGIAGGSQSEQRATALEFVRHLHPPVDTSEDARACLVILELGAGANFTNDHLIHPRAINIYDWQTTQFVTRLTTPGMSLRQRVGRIGYALAAMALHYMNVGMLSNRIFPAPLDNAMLHDETVEDRRGLLVMPRQTPYLERIAATIATAPPQPQMANAAVLPGNTELLDTLEAASAVDHVQFVYVVLPKITDLWEQVNYPSSVATAGGVVPIVNLAQPRRYPQIYDAHLWYDNAHVNERGAQLITTLLAEELKRWYAAHGQTLRCGR